MRKVDSQLKSRRRQREISRQRKTKQRLDAFAESMKGQEFTLVPHPAISNCWIQRPIN